MATTTYDRCVLRCRTCKWVGTLSQVEKSGGGSGYLYCPRCTAHGGDNWEEIASERMDGKDGWPDNNEVTGGDSRPVN